MTFLLDEEKKKATKAKEGSYRDTWHFLLNTDSFHKQWIYAVDLLKRGSWKNKE